ncbi:hypothetical protein Mgra_00002622 [Meloidogyne graminicola]|uniref:Uncharacterized protein n=1 Tax=Meloidogyne graminicola TaxID=189291 RepID=A0A8S9ZXF8_9BILA|nr:hypothetical protein Mgra_00002622 [Meloidogyne graminicola]
MNLIKRSSSLNNFNQNDLISNLTFIESAFNSLKNSSLSIYASTLSVVGLFNINNNNLNNKRINSINSNEPINLFI